MLQLPAALVLFCSCSLIVFDSDDEEEDGTEEEDEEEEEEKEEEDKPAKIKFIKGQLMSDRHLYDQLCLSHQTLSNM